MGQELNIIKKTKEILNMLNHQLSEIEDKRRTTENNINHLESCNYNLSNKASSLENDKSEILSAKNYFKKQKIQSLIFFLIYIASTQLMFSLPNIFDEVRLLVNMVSISGGAAFFTNSYFKDTRAKRYKIKRSNLEKINLEIEETNETIKKNDVNLNDFKKEYDSYDEEYNNIKSEISIIEKELSVIENKRSEELERIISKLDAQNNIDIDFEMTGVSRRSK